MLPDWHFVPTELSNSTPRASKSSKNLRRSSISKATCNHLPKEWQFWVPIGYGAANNKPQPSRLLSSQVQHDQPLLIELKIFSHPHSKSAWCTAAHNKGASDEHAAAIHAQSNAAWQPSQQALFCWVQTYANLLMCKGTREHTWLNPIDGFARCKPTQVCSGARAPTSTPGQTFAAAPAGLPSSVSAPGASGSPPAPSLWPQAASHDTCVPRHSTSTQQVQRDASKGGMMQLSPLAHSRRLVSKHRPVTHWYTATG
eukprot:1139290-Pelagomonas_calceolata.AAC.1